MAIAIAIAIPRGAVVESLVERGFHVYAINPKQLDRFRDRHTVVGAKDDRRDAFVLADSLRTDRPLFRLVRVDDPLVIQLREMSRVDDDLAEDMNRLTNRLREQIHRYYASLLRLSPSADEPWLWALWELAPTPAAGAQLKPKQIAELLADHRIRRLDVRVRAAKGMPNYIPAEKFPSCMGARWPAKTTTRGPGRSPLHHDMLLMFISEWGSYASHHFACLVQYCRVLSSLPRYICASYYRRPQYRRKCSKATRSLYRGMHKESECSPTRCIR